MKKKTIIAIIAFVLALLLLIGALGIYRLSDNLFNKFQDALGDLTDTSEWQPSGSVTEAPAGSSSGSGSETETVLQTFSKSDLDVVAMDNSDIALLGYQVQLKPNTEYYISWELDPAAFNGEPFWYISLGSNQWTVYYRYDYGGSGSFQTWEFDTEATHLKSTYKLFRTDDTGNFSVYFFEMDFESVSKVIAAKGLVDQYVKSISIEEYNDDK